MRRVPILFLLLATALTAPSALAGPKRGAHAGRTHVVYPGQTLGMIAKRYNVTVDALCKANGIKRRAPIRPKQTLVIPTTGAKVTPPESEKASDDGPSRSAKTTATAAKRPTKKVAAEAPAAKASKDPWKKRPRRRGYVTLEGTSGSWKGTALARGKITERAQAGFEKVLASWRTGKKETIHPRLIRVLTQISDHFGGRTIRVVSGYRPYSPTQYTPHSRHNAGRAVDFSIPGVPNSVVRDYARTLPNVGVGYYPNSSFVHLDVREASTYWIDYSGPGEAPRYANEKGEDPGRATPGKSDSDGDDHAESDGNDG